MATHKAYVQSQANGPVTLQPILTPTPQTGQVLITVLATPLLSYTQGVLSGDLFPLVHPLTPGIAAVGRVASCGPDCTTLTANQLVFCSPIVRARDDPSGGTSILQGWFGGMTPQARKLMEGPWRHGSWAEKMVVPVENAVPLDETRLVKELGYAVPQLVWINEFMVPFGGLLAAGVGPGATVIVAPATGHFGGCTVQVALAMGARTVVAAGRSRAVLKKVGELDSGGRVKAVALTGEVEADANALRSATPAGAGADAYIDFSPPQAEGANHPQACVSALRYAGQAVLMGGIRGNLSLNYAQLMISNISVRGNFMYGPEAPAKFVGLLEGGLISLKGLNTEVFGFDKLHEGFRFAESHVGSTELTVLTPVVE